MFFKAFNFREGFPQFDGNTAKKLLRPGHTERDAITRRGPLPAAFIVAPCYFYCCDHTKHSALMHRVHKACFGKCKINRERRRDFGVARPLELSGDHCASCVEFLRAKVASR